MASPSSTSNNSAVSPVAASGTTTPGAGAPCAACKFLRRKCLPGCVFAPYFPPEEPQKFANVHKVFGASNVTKLLNELLPHQREDAVSSLAYEAEARVKDPVYGCVGAISLLQRQVHRLQKELDAAHAELLRYACNDMGIPTALPVSAAPRLSTAMPRPGHLAAATVAAMYSGRRLGVVDGIAPPAGCYFTRNNVISSPGAEVAPVLPYASMANWAVNAISATTTATSGSESIGMDHKEVGDSSM
ncbi:LOB domain-containing protein 6-like [Phragmites australis]|uniref:LOB domain-containing protein 6-like n=1 Tax=Phragmites australis TaxID=29695 RepID=UPI002D78618B|nr:LOB domain-containing protein 6-like [Phragmites australis]XP_062194664.1 LOB domain-containing protein 6-like [Phragmites australis]XP_062201120.1 LOB domain-containing protein 6-like [Phragmites australis]XP_062206344.1 LOB domain-containing protein 6-like [Phragmites australis]